MTTRQWGYDDYRKACLERLQANIDEIKREGTIGKEISMLARIEVSDPPEQWASSLITELQREVEQNPVEGYKFEFSLIPHKGKATIKMRFYKV